MRKSVFALTAISLSALFADSNKPDFIQKSPQLIADSSSINEPSAPALNSSARLHFNLYGDFLYWNAYIPDNSWTYAYNYTTTPTTQSYKGIDFNWNPGFRVGLAFETTWQNLIIDFNWTNYDTHGHRHYTNLNSESADVNQGFTILYVSSLITTEGSIYSADAKFKIRLNQFDLTLKKRFATAGNHLTLIPYMGYRATMLSYSTKQSFIYNFYGDSFSATFPKNTYQVAHHSKLFGQGLLAGLKGDLALGKGFNFLISADGALLVGSDKDYNSETYFSDQNPASADRRKKSTKFRAVADFETGFMWHRNFSNETWGLAFKAAYEAHMYFDTPTLVYYAEPVQNLTTTFQGLSLAAAIQF